MATAVMRYPLSDVISSSNLPNQAHQKKLYEGGEEGEEENDDRTDADGGAQMGNSRADRTQKLGNRSSHNGNQVAYRKFCTAHGNGISRVAQNRLRGKHCREQHHQKSQEGCVILFDGCR